MIETKRINNLEFKVATYLLKNPPEIKAYHINRYMPNCYYGHESDFIKINKCDHYMLEFFEMLVALQILSMEISIRLKNDVDMPRNLAKSVTVE